MNDPLFLLAPGRSFTSVVSGMLGQHPQMYAFPELYLTIAATMREWWIRCGCGRTERHHGLLRAVAQLFFHEQTEASVAKAWDWINARFQWETTAVFHTLMERIEPKMAVEKSPALANREEFLERVLNSFPKARFLHITRHPRGTCESMFRFDYSIYLLAQSGTAYDFSTDPPTLDPQMWWYETHKRIGDFIAQLPPMRRYRLHGERFMAEPQTYLPSIIDWLQLPCDAAAIEQMMHPERSPYACVGPLSAQYGNDHSYLKNPEFRGYRPKPESLDGPLPWRPDGCGFLLEVKELAHTYGYT